jgi:hypothetical protein
MQWAPTKGLLSASLGCAASVAVLATGGCGAYGEAPDGADPGGPSAASPPGGPERAGAGRAEGHGRGRRSEEHRATAAPSHDGQGGAGTGCVFEPPEDRLGEDQVRIELVRATCEQGLRLAQTAALGQPAGANLELTRDGFDCDPSTLEKGANVTYTCVNGAREVTFDVVWSHSPP